MAVAESIDRQGVAGRALTLLGQGHPQSVVASALGVTESRISQLVADPAFAEEVQKLRYENLQSSTKLDEEYNNIEAKLQEKLRKSLPLINKPRDLLAAISVVNSAKRRGAQADAGTTVPQKVVQLSLPTNITQSFTTNINNQITEVRDENGNSQTLVTATSGSLDSFVQQQQRSAEYTPAQLTAPRSTEATQARPSKSSCTEGPITVDDL